MNKALKLQSWSRPDEALRVSLATCNTHKNNATKGKLFKSYKRVNSLQIGSS